MNITNKQLEIFKKLFNEHDRHGNESIDSLRCIEWEEDLKQHLITFNLNQGSTEFGFKNDFLIVAGKKIKLEENELLEIRSLLNQI